MFSYCSFSISSCRVLRNKVAAGWEGWALASRSEPSRSWSVRKAFESTRDTLTSLVLTCGPDLIRTPFAPSTACTNRIHCCLTRAVPSFPVELEPSSFPANVSSGTLQHFQDRLNMVNLRTLTSLTYLSQVVFIGANAKPHSSKLLDLVPKREVLYVGGQYTNVTASVNSNNFLTDLTLEHRTMQLIRHQWP